MTLASVWSQADARRRPDASALRCDVAETYADVSVRWAQLAARGHALAFQHVTWLRCWYETFGTASDVTPLLLTLVDLGTSRDVLALPLVRRRVGGLDHIEFADGGLTDYNAPILAANINSYDPAQLWTEIRRALPPADLFIGNKMPRQIGERDNPLASLNGVQPCRLSGNILHMPETYDDWHWGLERTFRKELERSLRVFLQAPGASFRRIEDPAEAQHVYSELKRLQAARIAALGLPYVLGEPQNEAFYDRLLRDGLADGSVILTALTTETEVAAALLGIRAGSHYAMMRLGVADGDWRKCSPGRLVIERTMKLLHADGLRDFDFTIGEYAYKRRLGVTPQPLVDLHVPLSWRGILPAESAKLRLHLRQNKTLATLRKRLRGA
jgi:CelD/BcsL family acetyltransferase involved in cellulose biosynthesis